MKNLVEEIITCFTVAVIIIATATVIVTVTVMCWGFLARSFLPDVHGDVPVNILSDVYIDASARVSTGGRVSADTVPAGNAHLMNCNILNFTGSLMQASPAGKAGTCCGTLSPGSSAGAARRTGVSAGESVTEKSTSIKQIHRE
jgi:hypothetical protein